MGCLPESTGDAGCFGTPASFWSGPRLLDFTFHVLWRQIEASSALRVWDRLHRARVRLSLGAANGDEAAAGPRSRRIRADAHETAHYGAADADHGAPG